MRIRISKRGLEVTGCVSLTAGSAGGSSARAFLPFCWFNGYLILISGSIFEPCNITPPNTPPVALNSFPSCGLQDEANRQQDNATQSHLFSLPSSSSSDEVKSCKDSKMFRAQKLNNPENLNIQLSSSLGVLLIAEEWNPGVGVRIDHRMRS